MATTTQQKLDSLIDKSPLDMTDLELEQHIRNIRHTGIKRATRRAETRQPINATQGREHKAIKELRVKLSAEGKSAAAIEQVISIFKATQAQVKK